MKNTIIFCSIIFSALALQAHNPANASFYIFEKNGTWTLRAEFAWSLRNAVLDTYPFLETENRSKAEFLDCIQEYTLEKIKVKVDETDLMFSNIQPIEGSHGHAMTFLMTAENKPIGNRISIENHCLFELYPGQRNYIFLETERRKEDCLTNRRKPECEFII